MATMILWIYNSSHFECRSLFGIFDGTRRKWMIDLITYAAFYGEPHAAFYNGSDMIETIVKKFKIERKYK
jgi:hypothetical protein